MTVLKHSHTISCITKYSAISTNWRSDYSMSFRYGTGVPYHRVSVNTIFHVQSKTRDHSAELASSFSPTVHQIKLTTNGPEQCSPTRYNTQNITTICNKMLCSIESVNSIQSKTHNNSKILSNRSHTRGFHRFPSRKRDFDPPFSKFSSR